MHSSRFKVRTVRNVVTSHKEHINNIDDFIWSMCVSYRKLNSVTLPFSYPPPCDDAIDDFGAVWAASRATTSE
jgi:hypothetical protein